MIIPSSKYPGQIDTSDATNYPQGKARNVVATGGLRSIVVQWASGGAGDSTHLAEAFEAGAEAAVVASIVHERPERLRELKRELKEAGWPIRG